MVSRSSVGVMTVMALLMSGGAFAQTQTLQEYAAECDETIGVSVPAFSCLIGADNLPLPVVPTTHKGGLWWPPHDCDRPNRLSGVCDPDSTFQVLHRSASVEIVALCRHKGNAPGTYGDVAVIQHNKDNGATCFYQALGLGLSAAVPAPVLGTQSYWKTPAGTAADGCQSCHDTGAFIRSPYLTQVAAPHTVPGAGMSGFNKNQRYYLLGDAFQSDRRFKVQVAGNTCMSCHSMGTSNLSSSNGTALDLGPRSVAWTEPSKVHNDPVNSPLWMTPGQGTWTQQSQDSAEAVRFCAQQARVAIANDSVFNLPAGCQVDEVGFWNSLTGVANSRPTAVAGPGANVDVLFRGLDQNVWTRQWEPSAQPPSPSLDTWAPYVTVGSGGTAQSVVDAIAVSGLGGTDLFDRDLNGSLRTKRRPYGHVRWSPSPSTWTDLGGQFQSNPVPVSFINQDRVDVLVRGMDNGVWRKSLVNGAWAPGYTQLGGLTYFAPAAVANGGTLEVFMRGTDDAIYRKGGRGWEFHNGQITNTPVALASGNGVVNVFGRDVYGQLWRLHNTNGAYTWEILGGSLPADSMPAVVSTGPGRITVFIRSTDSTIHRRDLVNGVWSQWKRLGGKFTSDPAAVVTYNNRIFVFARSANSVILWAKVQ